MVKHITALVVAATLVACSTTSGWSKGDTVNAMRFGRTVAATELQRAVNKGKIEPIVSEAILHAIDAAIEIYSANDEAERNEALKAAVWKAIDRAGELLAKRGESDSADEIARMTEDRG